MATSRFIIFVFYSLLLSFNSVAQSSINGKIVDSTTGKPIAHVEVFISGTTSGCITDDSGNFTLKVPFFPCVLVADHVSYESVIKPIKAVETINIKLTPSIYSIDEVSISGKNKRKKNLRYFYSHFINQNRSKIKIRNDSVLVFQRNEMRFKASSSKPLIIENYHLGYRIRVILEEFEVIVRDGPNGKQLPLNTMNGGEVMQVTGYYLYEPLENEYPLKKEQYEENRRTTYYGSYRHFLKSIYDNNPEQQGFEILTPSPKSEIPIFQTDDNLATHDYKQFVITADTLNITYYYDDDKFPIPKEEVEGRYYLFTRKSTIYSTSDPFIIRKNGTSPNLTFVIDGLMAIKSFANSLPDDYMPPHK